MPDDHLQPVAVPSSEPEWRREVAHRLEAYRSRRQRLQAADPQPRLPFTERGGAGPEGVEYRAALRKAARARRADPVEIAVAEPELDFACAEGEPARPEAPLVPVAELRERLRAGLLDLFFLLLAYAAFLVLFHSFGGQFSFGKSAAAIYGATFFLFYVQYFALFTVFGGSTPGMRLRGLRVVSFDGSRPSARQLLWRSAGYLVSGGTVLLGFFWSLWDEDHLTWQDRISQTYLTHAPLPPETQPEPTSG